MGQTNLKAVTVYFTDEEYEEIRKEAEDYDETVSAFIKARLGFQIRRRGAPINNKNRSKERKKVHLKQQQRS
jgi:hypothetical protein